MERPSRMSREPSQQLGVFVGGIVVQDGVYDLAWRHGSLDGCEEADELLVTMTGHATADDLAFEHAEGRKHGRSAIALVVVGEGRAFAPLHRQAGRTRLVAQQSIQALFRVAPLPAPHHRSADADQVGDLPHRQMVR